MSKKESVPSEADWGDYWTDQDAAYAHQQFGGKTLDEMIPRFRDLPLSASEDLMYMPEVPFRYYIYGFQYTLVPGASFPYESQDGYQRGLAAESFLGLVLWKLENSPNAILPIMEALMPVVECVAVNAQRQENDPCSDDFFLERLRRIRAVYDNL